MTDDGWMTTVEAAAIFGCSAKQWLVLSRKYGVQSRVEAMGVTLEGTRGRGRRYRWNPEAVLRARAEHKLFKLLRRKVASTRQQRDPARMLKARQTMLEKERRKYLTKVAHRRGITLEALCQEKGISLT